MEQEIDLRQVFGIIKKRLWIVIVLPLVAMIVSGIYSFYVLKPTYEASTTIIVSSREEVVSTSIDNNTIMANKNLVKTYSEVAKSRTVLETTINKLSLDMTVEALKSQVKVTPLNDTELFKISVTNGNPEVAATISNKVAESFSNRIKEIKKIDNISIVDWAIPPTGPISPNKQLNIAIAAVIGVMAALGIIFLLEFLDDTIKTQEDVETLLGIPVIGTVPDFNSKKLKGDISG